MTPYRDATPELRTLRLDTIAIPPALRMVGLRLLGFGLLMMVWGRIFTAWSLLCTLVGALAVAVHYLPRRPVMLAIDPVSDRLEIRTPRAFGAAVRRVRLSTIVELVTERTPLVVRVLLSTASGEQILLWSGPAALAEDLPARVREAVLPPLEDAKRVL